MARFVKVDKSDLLNLWEETLAVLHENGKDWDDIIAVQGKDFSISKDNFQEIARKTEYYPGYAGVEVAVDLVLIGKDFWFERSEYDGSEWWSFRKKPDIVERKQLVSVLASEDSGQTLQELNTASKTII